MARPIYETETGNAGETQQRGGETLPPNHGTPISDNQNSLRVGNRSPTLLEDFLLSENIFYFYSERIPERIVHARGPATLGWFECTDPIPELSLASLFAEKGRKRHCSPGSRQLREEPGQLTHSAMCAALR